jgi:hypothetical protein
MPHRSAALGRIEGIEPVGSKMLKRLMLCSVLAVLGWTASFAQTCANQWSVPALADLMKRSSSPDVIYRACAIKGQELLPVLHEITQSGAYRFTAAGAAQACLARLGDSVALEQLKDELNGQKSNENAIYKLARVRTNASIGILMDYLIRYEHDSSRILDMGDVGYDPLNLIVIQMKQIVPKGPDYNAATTYPMQLQKWREWWEQRGNTELFPSVEKRFSGDRYRQCLARKVGWGFADALLDLDNSDKEGALTGFFRDLAGPESAETPAFHTVRGNVQTILAKRGDKQEFEKIIAELNTTQYVDAIPKLLYIGNLKSVGALIESMDLVNFLAAGRKTLTKQTYDAEANRYLKFVFAALGAMVKTPPVMAQSPPTKESIERWKQWWKKPNRRKPFSSTAQCL